MNSEQSVASQRLHALVMTLSSHMARMNFASVWPNAVQSYDTWVQTLTADDAILLLDFANHPLELWNWQQLLMQFREQCIAVAQSVALRQDDVTLFRRARRVAARMQLRVAN